MSDLELIAVLNAEADRAVLFSVQMAFRSAAVRIELLAQQLADCKAELKPLMEKEIKQARTNQFFD